MKGTKLATTSDANGFYNISKIPPGTYTLCSKVIGYDTLFSEVTLKKGEIITKKLFLTKTSILLHSFQASANKEEANSEVGISVTKVTLKEISQVPAIGGQPDLAQYLAVLPGVVSTGDQGGQLYIRGGSPIQNKILLDGLTIYNPFHSIGLFSVFDMDIIRNIDIYTGGFNAQYGGRISSIIDITTRDGNKNEMGGKVDLSTFGAKILLEGPILKPKDGGGSISYIVSAKNSYLQETSKALYSYVDTAGLPFNYNDYYGKISFNGDNGNKLNIFGFNFTDKVHYNNISDFKWNSVGGGSNFVLVPSSSNMLIKGAFSYSDYKVELDEVNALPRTSEINGFNTNLDFSYFFGKNTFEYGVELNGFNTDFNFYNSVNRKIEQNDFTTEFGAFVKYKINTPKLVIEPGFRFQYYASLSNASPEPRIGIKYKVNDVFRLKASGGMYSQNLISTSSDRDVVNLFYGFLSGPDNLQETFKGQQVTSVLQKANHYIAGFEYDIFPFMEINVEGYVKQFTQLTDLNRNKLFDDDVEHSSVPDYLKKDFIVENGIAKGIDFLLKCEVQRLFLSVGYSLAFVTKSDDSTTFAPFYDRRHNINLMAVYKFGKKLKWEWDIRWNLGSGFPFTQTQGFYNSVNFSNGINTDITKANGDLGIQYADYNKARLPYYHRLDMSIKREFNFSKNVKLDATFSLTNVYNRDNLFYISRTQQIPVYQLPILPSIGLSLTF